MQGSPAGYPRAQAALPTRGGGEHAVVLRAWAAHVAYVVRALLGEGPEDRRLGAAINKFAANGRGVEAVGREQIDEELKQLDEELKDDLKQLDEESSDEVR